MPIRDFTCNQCRNQFEKLVRNDEHAACPSCGSTDLQRHLSSFAVGGGRPDPAPMPASCGAGGGMPGSCQFAQAD